MISFRRMRPPPHAGLAAATALLVAGLLLGGCVEPPAGGFLVPFDEVASGPLSEDEYETLGIRFSDAPAAAELTVGDERRPVLLTTASGWTWRGRVPEGARLQVGVQALPAAWEVAREVVARVAVRGGGEERELVVEAVPPGASGQWRDFAVDLSALAGETITLALSADLGGGVAGGRGERWIAWGPVSLHGTAVGHGDRPNVVLIVVDTLRADHLGAYGHHRGTSPQIDRRLAARGTLFESAYAQAPWTLPSVLSYLTGRHPGELIDPGGQPIAVPPEVPTLAERLRAAGYRTGAFVANPTLQPTVGFDRGFETWWAPPPVVASLSLAADAVNRRALPWLAAHAANPFFLYVHYMDPHDPYASPASGAERSPFHPDYDGELTGEMVHGVYLGEVELADPEEDRRQLAALYDSEIAYVDEKIGELIDAFGDQLVGRTLFVFTSDHGEEFLDHGGWKHGHTLYDEQIRVPLVFRWDGRVGEGRRVSGSVRLVDLVPTILAAAGLDLAPELDGADLMPVLGGIESLSRRAAVARHLSFGPVRSAAVLDGWKLILFNDQEPFEPADPVARATWPLDRRRLAPIELYDLSADPGEQRNLAGEEPERVEQLASPIHAQLDREMPGLRLMLDQAPRGSRVSGRLVLSAAPDGWLPYFLAAGDEVVAAAAGDGRHEVTFTWRAEGRQKGLHVLGEGIAIESVEVAIDGRPVADNRILLGHGDPYRGGAVPPRRLVTDDWPPLTSVPSRPVLRIWRRQSASDGAALTPADPTAAEAAADEERKRLRALGYAG
ncbi:MAG TPA: sulfatase [Thermoanaerobaculia bacterium]|nr:sulfatase [Thermoanaerobaculia bacterium]